MAADVGDSLFEVEVEVEVVQAEPGRLALALAETGAGPHEDPVAVREGGADCQHVVLRPCLQSARSSGRRPDGLRTARIACEPAVLGSGLEHAGQRGPDEADGGGPEFLFQPLLPAPEDVGAHGVQGECSEVRNDVAPHPLLDAARFRGGPGPAETARCGRPPLTARIGHLDP
ncbi:hypothetical protein OG413_35855 [Streptomyces sp. NBC_01433]|uniref:hypothetical protein n=1 Tax=Streptomyces sp. NBC_01433 TaxID=2903864 RepID=UPI002250B764|nr:hypothetical protein [Streptomyces sp. NBC_01433]MCX4680589.1 hypothetical protein [Streptomyces sp. NBC_01433]